MAEAAEGGSWGTAEKEAGGGTAVGFVDGVETAVWGVGEEGLDVDLY